MSPLFRMVVHGHGRQVLADKRQQTRDERAIAARLSQDDAFLRISADGKSYFTGKDSDPDKLLPNA